MFTRRRFLVLFPAFAASAQAQTVWSLKKKKPPPPPPPLNVYIGTDTSKGVSKGIYQSHFDTIRGQLTAPVLVAATARPSFLAITPVGQGRRFLYAVNAINEPAATVTSFAIDPKSGALRQAGQVSSGGAGPAYISVDASGHSAFVANYFGSSIALTASSPTAPSASRSTASTSKTTKSSAHSAPIQRARIFLTPIPPPSRGQPFPPCLRSRH